MFQKLPNFFSFLTFKKTIKCANNSQCSNLISVCKLTFFFTKEKKYCENCTNFPYIEKIKKWNLVDREFQKKGINLTDVHFSDTFFLNIENDHFFMYAFESLEFLQEFFLSQSFPLPTKEKEYQNHYQKNLFYQQFIFLIRDKEIINSRFWKTILEQEKPAKRKRMVMLIALTLEICELFNLWKSQNPLFYSLEFQNRIADTLKKLQKIQPWTIWWKRGWQKLTKFLGSNVTPIILGLNLVWTIIAFLLLFVFK